MKKDRVSLRKTLCCVLLAALLAVPPLPARATEDAAGLEASSQETQPVQAAETSLLLTEGSMYDAEADRISLIGGTLDGEFSSTKYSYNITLGADEEHFSIVASSLEAKDPPTMTLFVGDDQFDTLTSEKPSKAIAVAQGEEKKVTLKTKASAPMLENQYDEYSYTFTVRRAEKIFHWTPGEVIQINGVNALPVTVSADIGLNLQTVELDMSFDATKLQVCDKESGELAANLYKGFVYNDSNFLKVTNQTLDNAAGTLHLAFGQNGSSALDDYLVRAGNQELFTLYFRVSGELEWNSFSCRKFSSLQEFGTGFYTLSSPELLTMEGSAAPAKYSVILPRMTYTEKDISIGSVGIAPENKTSFFEGECLTLTATPKPRYQFERWDAGESGVDVSNAGAVLELPVAGDMDLSTLTPVFFKSLNLPTSEYVDQTAPYGGDYLLTVNMGTSTAGSVTLASQNEAYDLSEAIGDETAAWEQETDENGLTVLEMPHDVLWEETPQQSVPDDLLMSMSIEIGDQKTFWTRNMNATVAENKWVSKQFTLKATGTNYNLWFEDNNQMQVTQEQFAELGNSFAQSLTTLNNKFGSVYDRDGNGKLDILLYDIQDEYSLGKSSSYYAGLFNAGELYGDLNARWPSCANNADILHLDTYPSMGTDCSAPEILQIKSTMAHETQHIALASSAHDSIVDGGATREQYTAMQPPTWINEGLSLTVEHELFGTRDDRINTYNTSSRIRSGYSLTSWGNRVEDYALSYLFLQYLRTQAEAAGTDSLMQRFYADYTGDSNAVILNIIQAGIPRFKNMTFGEIVTCFYAALLLQEDSGAYGFGGDRDFDTVMPQEYSGSTATLPVNAAVYKRISEQVSPTVQQNIARLGLTSVPITVTSASTGGRVSKSPDKATYSKGNLVILTAVPDDGYEFIRWEGDVPANQKNDRTIVLRLYRSNSAVPVFGLIPLTVSTSANAGGSVTRSPDQAIYYKGDSVTLTAIPYTGYEFVRWQGDVPANQQNEESVTLTLDRSISVLAEFNKPAMPQTLVEGMDNVTQEDNGLKLSSSQGSVTIKPKDEGTPLTAADPIPKGTYELEASSEQEGQQFLYWRIWEESELTDSGSMESASIMAGPQLIKDNPYDCYITGNTRILPEYGEKENIVESGPRLLEIVPQMQGRFLILNGDTGNGIQSGENTQEYNLYLTQDETQMRLSILSEGSAERLTVEGSKTEELVPVQDGQERRWTEEGSDALTLMLDAAQTGGTVTLTTYDKNLATRQYTINLIRAEAPSVRLMKENGNIVAKVSAGMINTIKLQFKLGQAYQSYKAENSNTVYETAAMLNGNDLSVTLYPKDSAATAVTTEQTVVLLKNVTGSLRDVVEELSAENYIFDNRFGVLYNTVTLDDTYQLTGTVEAYNANELPVVTLNGASLKVTVMEVESGKFGLRQFTFKAVLEGAEEYTLTVTKENHTGYTLEGINLTRDVALEPLRLYAGELDGVDGINAFDADRLVSLLARGQSGPDLDGDGKLTVFDINLLADNYGKQGTTAAYAGG